MAVEKIASLATAVAVQTFNGSLGRDTFVCQNSISEVLQTIVTGTRHAYKPDEAFGHALFRQTGG